MTRAGGGGARAGTAGAREGNAGAALAGGAGAWGGGGAGVDGFGGVPLEGGGGALGVDDGATRPGTAGGLPNVGGLAGDSVRPDGTTGDKNRLNLDCPVLKASTWAFRLQKDLPIAEGHRQMEQRAQTSGLVDQHQRRRAWGRPQAHCDHLFLPFSTSFQPGSV